MSCSSLWSSRMRPICTRSEEHTSELQSPCNLVCRLLLEKKKTKPSKIKQTSRKHSRRRPYASYSFLRVLLWCCLSFWFYSLCLVSWFFFFFFFFNDTATTEIYTLSLHDALPISSECHRRYDDDRNLGLHSL